MFFSLSFPRATFWAQVASRACCVSSGCLVLPGACEVNIVNALSTFLFYCNRLSKHIQTGHFTVEPQAWENWGGPRSQWLKPSGWGEDTAAGRGLGLRTIRDRILVTFIDIQLHFTIFGSGAPLRRLTWLMFAAAWWLIGVFVPCTADIPWPSIYSWCMLPSETLVSTSCPAQSSLPFLLDTSDFILCKCWMFKVALERLLLSGTCWRSRCCPKAHRCSKHASTACNWVVVTRNPPELSLSLAGNLQLPAFHFISWRALLLHSRKMSEDIL